MFNLELKGLFSPPDIGSMHPYSRVIANPNHEINAPTTHNTRVIHILPTERTIDPGVAKIPLPITRDMMRMYALHQPMLQTQYSSLREDITLHRPIKMGVTMVRLFDSARI